jgi:hypothetical protein
MNDSLRVIPSMDRCRYLHSKGMYINAGIPEEEQTVGDGHYWCGRNQRIYGPDNELCGQEHCCSPGRSCYEAP